jgi:hypothetical protein
VAPQSTTDTEASPRSRTGLDRLARALTEVFAPAVLAAAMPLVVALHTAGGLGAGLAWGLLAALFSAVIPYGVILFGVRRGRLTDRHIGRREQRRGPLLIGLASVLVGVLALALAGAPRQLVTLVIGMFLVLLMVTAINHWWKLSAHAAVAAASTALLVLLFGPVLLVAVPVLLAVGWSRVRLGDHTAAQVAAGLLTGAALALGIFAVLW